MPRMTSYPVSGRVTRSKRSVYEQTRTEAAGTMLPVVCVLPSAKVTVSWRGRLVVSTFHFCTKVVEMKLPVAPLSSMKTHGWPLRVPTNLINRRVGEGEEYIEFTCDGDNMAGTEDLADEEIAAVGGGSDGELGEGGDGAEPCMESGLDRCPWRTSKRFVVMIFEPGPTSLTSPRSCTPPSCDRPPYI